MTTVLWFRRDLRLADHLALRRAAAAGPVVPLFVVNPFALRLTGPVRTAFLLRCLRALDDSMGGRLVVKVGDPHDIVPIVAKEVEAAAVYVSTDFGGYGRGRDWDVASSLEMGGRQFLRVGSPYAVEPGTIRNGGGQPFQVFTPFYRAWRAHGWAQPLAPPHEVRWVEGVRSDDLPPEPRVEARLPPAGEAAALARVDAFLAGPAAHYDALRDQPAADASSRLSPYLKFGCIHPRQVLARLGGSKAHEKLRSEVAWREFYADVLWHRPGASSASLQPAMAGMRVDTGRQADERFRAWAEGRTGYPFVDAGMRQLLAEAWMPNRVRMVVASFLVKDLHIDWTRGARWFLRHLVDGDPASNSLNWQWVAGTGTDPAPYFRIFNPVTQGKEHDPDGDYVRRWVPELAGVAAAAVHEPWKLPGGVPSGYPERIVDHATERAEALARYSALKSGR
ncbi:MAG: DNA photolyase family protein [Actinomycetota bacterium]|nr:DNA photolyase family protein [Actinomycetota bacterium]